MEVVLAYSELIKDFNRIRSYIRDFYVFGFRSREEYARIYQQSSRSYDNERRRVESWMGEYLSFHQNASGKKVFLSAAGSSILHNPLYRVFKAKSFTRNDIVLHFYLMDAFGAFGKMDQKQLMEVLVEEYPETFEEYELPDEKTVRLKLKELEQMGLLTSEKNKNRVVYGLVPEDIDLSLPGLWDAVDFFSEAAPLGVIGSFLLDKRLDGNNEMMPEEGPEFFRFRHHYLMQAIDSAVLCELLLAMGEKRRIEARVDNPVIGSASYIMTPVKIFISVENGREYLLSWNSTQQRFYFSRLDRIIQIKLLEPDPRRDEVLDLFSEKRKHLWGVSFGGLEAVSVPHRLEMEIYVGEGEYFITDRLQREKRCGKVEMLAEDRYLFQADVYDTMEILPWCCSFIGRIRRFRCSDPGVEEKFMLYLSVMAEHYGISLPEHPGRTEPRSETGREGRTEPRSEAGNEGRTELRSEAGSEGRTELRSGAGNEGRTEPRSGKGEQGGKASDGRQPGRSAPADIPDVGKIAGRAAGYGKKAALAKGNTVIFHEVYGAYYNAAARALALAVRGELTPRTLMKVVRDEAFAESGINIPDRMLSGEWPFLTEDLETNLVKEPTMPLTLIQKRWLRALLEDPRIRLFLPEETIRKLMTEQLKGIEPLFFRDSFCFFDQFSDGDPYDDPQYREHFQTILEALRKDLGIRISYRNKFGTLREMMLKPVSIEYSSREDKFRVYADSGEDTTWKEPFRLNINRMASCALWQCPETIVAREPVKDQAILELTDTENALERAMFHFSYLEKKTERLEDGIYRITLYYPKVDEIEVLIRILSFGLQIRVVSGGIIRDEIRRRLEAQLEMPELFS